MSLSIKYVHSLSLSPDCGINDKSTCTVILEGGLDSILPRLRRRMQAQDRTMADRHSYAQAAGEASLYTYQSTQTTEDFDGAHTVQYTQSQPSSFTNQFHECGFDLVGPPVWTCVGSGYYSMFSPHPDPNMTPHHPVGGMMPYDPFGNMTSVQSYSNMSGVHPSSADTYLGDPQGGSFPAFPQQEWNQGHSFRSMVSGTASGAGSG